MVLISPDETPAFVFFPYAGAVVSIVRSTENGSMVEAGVIGGEGMFSVQTVLTKPAPTGSEAIVQIDGRFARVAHARLDSQFRANEPFRDVLLTFTSVFLEQVTQNLVCNRLHAIEARRAKWLLIVRDRIDTDQLHLTQEFLAHMLGIHRPGVSIAVGALEVDGLVSHSRNWIEIRDREGLLKRSCECYAVVHAKLQQFRSAYSVRNHTDAA
ncbi:MAG TPA: Crp/Fnr family transcriptional regulator [Thermoanaerobaculia bacterium]